MPLLIDKKTKNSPQKKFRLRKLLFHIHRKLEYEDKNLSMLRAKLSVTFFIDF